MFIVKINPIEFTDWPNLFKLLQESFAYMDDRIDPPSSFHQLDVNSLEHKAKEENFIIATRANQLVGCAFFKPLDQVMYVGKVAVLSECRHQGLARIMFSKVEKLAQANNFKFLELETRVELTENHQAFASMGFQKTGESAHKGYARPTSITMRKRI